jgi:hypothetical protein
MTAPTARAIASVAVCAFGAFVVGVTPHTGHGVLLVLIGLVVIWRDA